MDDLDRHKIMSNIDGLVKVINYVILRDNCLRSGMLSTVMVHEIEKHNESEEEKCKRMLQKITKRGPDAFSLLCRICGERSLAYNLLCPAVNSGLWANVNSKASRTKYEPIPGEGEGQWVLQPFVGKVKPAIEFVVKKSNKFHVHDKVQTYHMRSKNRGVLFLVNIVNFNNIDERKGAYADRDGLIHLFRQLGFVIFYYEDIDWKDLNGLLDELVVSDYLRYTDCFVFGIMSHGTIENGKELVEFGNHSHINVDCIISKFYNTNCELLDRKPKVFIMPYCRGSVTDTGVWRNRTNNRLETDHGNVKEREVRAPRNVSTKSDILICHATVPEFQALRDAEFGSWYIQHLCNVIAEHAHDTDLETMLKILTSKMMEWRNEKQASIQTPATSAWGFGPALFFNPGFYQS